MLLEWERLDAEMPATAEGVGNGDRNHRACFGSCETHTDARIALRPQPQRGGGLEPVFFAISEDVDRMPWCQSRDGAWQKTCSVGTAILAQHPSRLCYRRRVRTWVQLSL